MNRLSNEKFCHWSEELNMLWLILQATSNIELKSILHWRKLSRKHRCKLFRENVIFPKCNVSSPILLYAQRRSFISSRYLSQLSVKCHFKFPNHVLGAFKSVLYEFCKWPVKSSTRYFYRNANFNNLTATNKFVWDSKTQFIFPFMSLTVQGRSITDSDNKSLCLSALTMWSKFPDELSVNLSRSLR